MTGFFEMRTEDQTIEQEIKKKNNQARKNLRSLQIGRLFAMKVATKTTSISEKSRLT